MARKGDLFVNLTDPPLRRALRQASVDTDRTIRSLVREFLAAGLAQSGYSVESSPVTNMQKETATINHERVSA